ncbi:nicotinate-nucleotide adenylyltransferase [Chitinolyticbacter meiyuanensis]|uniref:nicotinate-nucleotide adenylyltransferase n=1 Tax=Chitinolyticbacter meiyuanensis TaxID=682798 RepID=UPI0011E5D11D|nr:nicotinate-nucleotide adenylyltransferase [Chitinolyticbacter meiyuanensis]
MNTLGVYGGTFNPIHHGHLALARGLRNTFALPEVRLIPTGEPPHRPPPQVPAAQRFAWVRDALAGEAGLIADDIELRRSGYSYTIDTLTQLQRERPDALLVWLIGADSLAQLPTWRDWRQLLELGHLVVAARPDTDLASLPAEIAVEFARRRLEAKPDALTKGKLSVLPSPLLPFSSTELRARLACGEDISAQSPVARAIMDSGLYRNHA